MGYQEHADAIASRAADTVDDVKAGVAKASDKLKKDKDDVQRDIAKRAAEFSMQVAKSLEQLGVDTKEIQAAVGDTVEKIGGDVRGMIRDRPVGAVLAAAAFGMLVGLMSSR